MQVSAIVIGHERNNRTSSTVFIYGIRFLVIWLNVNLTLLKIKTFRFEEEDCHEDEIQLKVFSRLLKT